MAEDLELVEEHEAKGFDSARFNALVALADLAAKRTAERSQREMRLTFAVWAFLVAATFYVHPRPPELIVELMLCAVFVLHSGFVMDIRIRSRWDTIVSGYFTDLAANEVGEGFSSHPPPHPKDRMWTIWATPGERVLGPFRSDFWWSGLQIMVTLSLCLAAYALMGHFAKVGP